KRCPFLGGNAEAVSISNRVFAHSTSRPRALWPRISRATQRAAGSAARASSRAHHADGVTGLGVLGGFPPDHFLGRRHASRLYASGRESLCSRRREVDSELEPAYGASA